jgi:predicted AlkP superfamily pyrophosphatase or phosphodiesterase
LWLAVALVGLAPGRADADERVRNKILIIGIDGCRPDALRRAQAPHLAGLIRDGAFSDQAQTGDITISGPGWASLVTGVWRTKHGVRDNDFDGANFGQYPHFFRRLKQHRPRAFTASLVHWGPINTRLVVDSDFTRTYRQDRRVADEACRLLQEQDPDVVFLQFDDVDAAGHKHGFDPAGLPYRQAIEQVDAHVGSLLEVLRRRPTYAKESWLILVSTDHGGSGKAHGENIPEHRTIFLIVSGSAAARGVITPAPRVVDLAPTALTHLGVPIDPKWDWDGRPVGLKPRTPTRD